MNRHVVTVRLVTEHTFAVDLSGNVDPMAQIAEATDQVRNRWGMGERGGSTYTAPPTFRWERAEQRS